PSSELVLDSLHGEVFERTSDFERDRDVLIDKMIRQLERPFISGDMERRYVHVKRYQEGNNDIVRWVEKC
ncbi:MAG: hypothetical protein D6732_27340, partial [Methanobacteriota archaeon]